MSSSLLVAVRRFVGGGALALVVSGIGHLGALPPDPGAAASSSAAAVVDLVDGDLAVGGLPPGFQADYPLSVTAEGLVRADGGCSTPLGLGPEEFTEPCRRHDLGYDLLRQAEARGETLGPWARVAVDRRLSADLAAACDSVGCRLLASVYDFFVTANSIRQGFASPRAEPLLPWLSLLAGLLVVSGWRGGRWSAGRRSALNRPRFT